MRIGIIGLGYVGLPLAVCFASKFEVVGFDINEDRIDQLQKKVDITGEISEIQLSSSNLTLTSDIANLYACTTYIVAVPTPITDCNLPDFEYLDLACDSIGSQLLKTGDVVIFESTVYPGVTENRCAKRLEDSSGLALNVDFFVGYSPERINPGDSSRPIESIIKVTSGSTPEVAKLIDDLYASVIRAGTYLASSIKVAEAAKAIENTQRDVNIALVNELAIAFSAMGINVNEVIDTACTKWNFADFRPGLVGGHCIGVDPHYLAHGFREYGIYPEMVLAGRRINEGMSEYVAMRVTDLIVTHRLNLERLHILVLGATFKENCPDLRNSKALDVVSYLRGKGLSVDVCDPCAAKAQPRQFMTIDDIEYGRYELVVILVPHRDILKGFANIYSRLNGKRLIFDLKGALPDIYKAQTL